MDNKKLTKFEKILKTMSVDEKSQVMRHLNELENMFKSKVVENNENWFDAIGEDEVLRNIFICSCIASNEWFVAYKRSKSNN